jgi:hypothetical protein
VVFGHLAVDASPGLVDEIVKRASPAEGPEWHRTSGAAEASIGRWRRDMSPELLGLTEELFGEVMEAEGYERGA